MNPDEVKSQQLLSEIDGLIRKLRDTNEEDFTDAAWHEWGEKLADWNRRADEHLRGTDER